MTTLEKQFSEAYIKNCEKAQQQCSCRLVRMMQQTQKYGGVKMAQELIKKGKLSDEFDKLKEEGLLHLTLEALVIQPEYADLFSDDEVNSCYEYLCECGYY